MKHWRFIISSVKVTINILQHNILVYVNININKFNILIALCEIGYTEIKDIILEILCIIQNKKRSGGKILVMHKTNMGKIFIVFTQLELLYMSGSEIMEELTEIERLKLSLKYSTSEKHKKSLRERIDKIENKVDIKIKEENMQQSFL
ncbi:MAG: hypothetical protein LKF87_03880 [Clostridium tyrobutyricum]|uniref:hypothetical protein n=2 Tax=Clostridium tyrobutyricum TaxID=1519 RepID=UPI0024325440|nr:hypothetical protein [Clostridium tyrobutyricum]MCH4199257.1 hypothetical protein [Clostridium tyrobutyricum]MCH4236589.1 hypothetical protein [Clostridium tyrobutyricum]MCH4258095.1 hypothetical protein [Clostridium tyrobutyricum]MCI1651394.1 hypothetical protein [Clostridium tyrobutyricum]MCI2010289.1 hypothetical protein [Clostridium tyrobutyricum]